VTLVDLQSMLPATSTLETSSTSVGSYGTRVVR